MNDPDLEDARKAQGGDREAFDRLCARHLDGLFAFVLRLCGNRATAEDIVQTAFVQTFKGIGKFRAEAKFKTWLYEIARNEWLAAQRKKSATEVSLEAVAESDPPAPNSTTDTASQEVERAVSELPDEQKTAVQLFYWSGMSIKEISLIMRESETNVKVILFRARQALKNRLTSRRERENG